MNGSYTPQTVPLGGKALAERLQSQTPAQTQPDTVPWTNTELRCCVEMHTVEFFILGISLVHSHQRSGAASPASLLFWLLVSRL